MNMAAHRETRFENSVSVERRAGRDAAARGAEAERQRVRDALHDGLGQLLTSISFLADSLRSKLAARRLPEAGEAEDLIALTKRAIQEAQSLVPEEESPEFPAH
jgi:signal transduction histidine kinase